MPWLSTGDSTDDQKKDDKDDPLDLSQLGTGDGLGDVDAPVTSGSDPSSWDPINIDQIPE